jgi:hypothetical protein
MIGWILDHPIISLMLAFCAFMIVRGIRQAIKGDEDRPIG